MPREPKKRFLGPLKSSYGADPVAGKVAAIMEAHRATIERGKAMVAEVDPDRTFDALLSGRITGTPSQLELFAGLKLAKPRKPRKLTYRPYQAACDRRMRALQMKRAGATRREIAEELCVTARAVSRYLHQWREQGELPAVVPGRPRQ